MTSANEEVIRAMIDGAGEVDDLPTKPVSKPRILVDPANPDSTVAALRDILKTSDGLYDRGLPVRLARDQTTGTTRIQPLTPDGLIRVAHEKCRPFRLKTFHGVTEEVDCKFPRDLATMYLQWQGSWNLPVLNGVASSPMLSADGQIRSAEGYDPVSGMWCENVPDVADLVPAVPTDEQARAALLEVRKFFSTFSFADAEMFTDEKTGVAHVRLDQPAGVDESGHLCALLTAVCRPSLHLAPGHLIKAPSISGAGSGKGLLVRTHCQIAFGHQPHAVTGGVKSDELEKRLASELMGGSSVMFLDNLNRAGFRSDLLASAITERPARIRVLGRSEMLPLNATAFIAITGNGLTVSEDLIRRFITTELDAKTEDPEARRFTEDILQAAKDRRIEMLAAILTIWRWGRQHRALPKGGALGSFSQWSEWVRDPLLALGCKDPAERIREAKERDGYRQEIGEIFTIWWSKHGDRPVAVKNLGEDVIQVLDPQSRGRQFLQAAVDKLTGTRMAGFLMHRQPPAGRWGVATYALKKTSDSKEHGDHRGHRPTIGTENDEWGWKQTL